MTPANEPAIECADKQPNAVMLVHMSIDISFLEILACPSEDHAPLTYDETAQVLECTSCQRVYRIEDGIPVLLLDESQ